ELVHVVHDEEDEFVDTDKKLVELASNLVRTTPITRFDSPISSEWMAEIGATELLFPWILVGEAHHMQRRGASTNDIAMRFRIPEKVVERRLRGGPLWTTIDGLHAELV